MQAVRRKKNSVRITKGMADEEDKKRRGKGCKVIGNELFFLSGGRADGKQEEGEIKTSAVKIHSKCSQDETPPN